MRRSRSSTFPADYLLKASRSFLLLLIISTFCRFCLSQNRQNAQAKDVENGAWMDLLRHDAYQNTKKENIERPSSVSDGGTIDGYRRVLDEAVRNESVWADFKLRPAYYDVLPIPEDLWLCTFYLVFSQKLAGAAGRRAAVAARAAVAQRGRADSDAVMIGGDELPVPPLYASGGFDPETDGKFLCGCGAPGVGAGPNLYLQEHEEATAAIVGDKIPPPVANMATRSSRSDMTTWTVHHPQNVSSSALLRRMPIRGARLFGLARKYVRDLESPIDRKPPSKCGERRSIDGRHGRVYAIEGAYFRYLKDLIDFSLLFKDMTNWHVAEIGVGFGGMAHAILHTWALASYTLVDLPEGERLAAKYLKEVLRKPSSKGKDADIFLWNAEVRKNATDTSSKHSARTASSRSAAFGPPAIFDLCFSHYAFSELSIHIASYYSHAILRRCKRIVIAWNLVTLQSAPTKLTRRELSYRWLMSKVDIYSGFNDAAQTMLLPWARMMARNMLAREAEVHSNSASPRASQACLPLEHVRHAYFLSNPARLYPRGARLNATRAFPRNSAVQTMVWGLPKWQPRGTNAGRGSDAHCRIIDPFRGKWKTRREEKELNQSSSVVESSAGGGTSSSEVLAGGSTSTPHSDGALVDIQQESIGDPEDFQLSGRSDAEVFFGLFPDLPWTFSDITTCTRIVFFSTDPVDALRAREWGRLRRAAWREMSKHDVPPEFLAKMV